MKLYQVDAFTDKLFTGNPAAVCIVDKDMPGDILQKIAFEMNLSETAFVRFIRPHKYSLRWFTPKVEVQMCGHATLATAHILWEEKYENPDDLIQFSTKSGVLTAEKKDKKIQLNFPQASVNRIDENPLLNDAFNISPVFTGRDSYRYLMEIDDESQIYELDPNFELLKKDDIKRYVITAKSKSKDFDFISRYFAPGVGVREDPVTGSAHCYLAPYWCKKLKKKRLIGFQASKRTGLVECEVIDNQRVLLRGNAVTVFSAELKL